MSSYRTAIALVALTIVGLVNGPALQPVSAQTSANPALPTPPAPTPPAPETELLSSADLENLVARIALYPDDLVALVLSATLNPLQIVQASRFLDQAKAKPDAKPDPTWDGSIVSLLNYPSVVTMMNDDLDWTEQLGDAVVGQQKDVLMAIQTLRDKAVENNVIKSDDKVTIVKQNDNIVIQPATKEVTYVPTYDPAILTSPTYVATSPIVYGDPYPSYYYPYAPYWAGFITGAAFGAIVDWDNWNAWGGDDIDIDVNNFDRNDFKFNKNNINNLDRSNLNFNRDSIGNNLRQNGLNRVDRRANRAGNAAGGLAGAGTRLQSNDVRRDVQNQLRQRDGGQRAGDLRNQAANRPGNRDVGQGLAANRPDRPNANRPNVDRPNANRPNIDRANRPNAGRPNANRPNAGRTNAPRPAARVDNRSRQPSAIGNYGPGRQARSASQRGNHSLSGGGRGGPRVGPGGGGRGGHGGGGRGGGRGGRR